MMPSYYEFYSPVKIVSGLKALENLPYELEHLGAVRPLIVSDRGVSQAGLTKFVFDAFSESAVSIGAVFDEVPPDSSLKVVTEAAAAFRANRCDSIVAVGGGSVIDTAKGANIVITEQSDDLAKFAGAELLKKPMKPLVVVPTTAGTGSEATLVTVIKDAARNVKMAFTSYHLMPNVAILDPRMTLTLPPRITAATAMDALTHAVEAYVCLQKNPVSDAFALSAIELIRDNLVKVVKDGKNVGGRLALANAACLAGIAFSNSMVGMIHALGHACGGVAGIPHGVAMSIFLPHGLEYNLHKSGDHIARLLLPLAGRQIYAQTPPEGMPIKTIAAIRQLQEELHQLAGLPRTLKEAGVASDMLAQIAETAIGDGSVVFNPEEMDRDDALKVLQKAYQ
ncbi:MAG: iron-containing alcohol dehydrogenase [Desulfobacterales bacterium]|nr:iron-containing alcohol dehydrogenase [Desulfobacterales bacterium]